MDPDRDDEPTDDPAVYGSVNIDPLGKKRIGDWIQTYTGRRFYLLDAHPYDFDIRDIAHALANQCRFTGHVRRFYSVAEHSVRVMECLRAWDHGETVQYQGLMHDASEGFLTDIARPFKQLPEFLFYREIEEKLMHKIAKTFDFEWPMYRAVKNADEVLLGTEARDLMAPVIDGWHFRYKHLRRKIRPWSPQKAERKFLAAYYRLSPVAARRPWWSFLNWAI